MLVRRGDAGALADALGDLLGDPDRRAGLSARGREAAWAYDWSVVARRVLAVYETVVLPGGGEVTASDDDADVISVPSADVPGRQPLRRRVRR